MVVHDVKTKSFVKDLTIGTGGHLINDVIDNSPKDHVKKVIDNNHYPWCFYGFFNQISKHHLQANYSTLTQPSATQDVTVNPNGKPTIGTRPKNVSNKNPPDPVPRDNILPSIQRPDILNVTVSKILSMNRPKGPVLSNLLGDPVPRVNWWSRTKMVA